MAYTLLLAVFLSWLTYNPLTFLPSIAVYGWDAGADLNALYEVEKLIPPQACVVSSNGIAPHYSLRPETYIIGVRGDMDGCTYMIVDLNDTRHNDFTDNEQVACYQFWSQKRTPIYYKDSVVVLQQMPASGSVTAGQQMQSFCDTYSQAQKHQQ